MNSDSQDKFAGIERRLENLENKFSDFERELATKANQKALDDTRKELTQKAAQTTVDEIRKELAKKADQTTVDEIRKELAKKADQTTVDEIRRELAKKADQTTVNEIRRELDKKADKKDLELVAQQVAKNTVGIEELKTKVDYNSERIDRLVVEVVNIREDMKLLETKADADKKFHLLMAAIDGLAKKIDSYQTEKSAVNHALTRQENRLDDHEERLKKLEAVST
ncbi:hypothetical protein EH223_01625 [candidate division KSB1 bacterium]|nr:hypothetical protein [candidate division KSB1 bacterium]RQW06897.1 MAG: hypothetical protein EH223_01625 [candidate division KSB1 bacterium]